VTTITFAVTFTARPGSPSRRSGMR
jgi:hypothetical protein